MEITTYDSARVDNVVLGMIHDDKVLGGISSIWKGKMFSDEGSNAIGQECVDFYRKHNKAPKDLIDGLMSNWAVQHPDKAAHKLMEYRLYKVDESRKRNEEGVNHLYVLETAAQIFSTTTLTKLTERVRAFISQGKVKEAETLVTEYTKISIAPNSGIDLFQDAEARKRLFNKDRKDPLVEYPGALGKLVGKRMYRGGFVSFLAPEKTGKTWMLCDVAWRAMLNRYRVAFFEIGDEEEEDIHERFAIRASGWPTESDEGWPFTVQYPIAIRKPPKTQDEIERCAEVEFHPMTFKRALKEKDCEKAYIELMNKKVKSLKSYFKLCVYPSLGIDVPGIISVMEGWEQMGWIPDVVIIDYADNLACSSSYKDFRHQTNHTWQELRGLSQKKKCLTVTATQANSDSYTKKTMDKRNFSEDKRKLAHATTVIGLNVTAEEKEKGIVRWNIIIGRKGAWSSRQCVHVASCLPLGEPTVISC